MIIASWIEAPWRLTAGWVMLHFLWVGAAIGVVAGAGRWLLPYRSELRHAFALACFAVLACAPVVILVCLPPEPSIEAPLPAHAVAPPEVADAGAPAPGIPGPHEAAGESAAQALLDTLVHVLPWLWVIGAPATLLMVASGLIGSERLRRQSRRLEHGELIERCRRLAQALGASCHVALGVCTRLSAPILVGIVKPMILLPPAALTGWSVEQLEMVLLHELAHVRRRDNLVNLLQRLVEAVLFFHPVVWWLSAWIRLEREMCCDRIVVAHTGKPRAYAETLAALAMPEAMFSTGALAMAEHRLVSRMRRILNLEDRSMTISAKTLGVVAALLAAALIGAFSYGDAGLAAPAADEEAAPDENRAPPPKVAGDGAGPGQPPTLEQRNTPKHKDDGKSAPSMSHRAIIEAYQQIQLTSRVAGAVKAVKADVGDRVQRGQLLIELDTPEVALELRQKTAMVQLAKAEFNQTRSSLRAAQAALEAAKALVQEAQAGVQGAKATAGQRQLEFNRLKELAAKKAITESLLEEGHAKLESARASLAAGEARLLSARAVAEENTAKVAGAEAHVQVAEARIDVAQADLQRMQAQLDATQIKAPFDGVVTRRAANVGDFSQAAGQNNAKPLITLAKTDLVRVVVQIPDRQVAQIKVGMPVRVHVDALPDQSVEGKIARLAPTLDPETRTLRAEIELVNQGQLLPGMSATVVLKTAK